MFSRDNWTSGFAGAIAGVLVMLVVNQFTDLHDEVTRTWLATALSKNEDFRSKVIEQMKKDPGFKGSNGIDGIDGKDGTDGSDASVCDKIIALRSEEGRGPYVKVHRNNFSATRMNPPYKTVGRGDGTFERFQIVCLDVVAQDPKGEGPGAAN